MQYKSRYANADGKKVGEWRGHALFQVFITYLNFPLIGKIVVPTFGTRHEYFVTKVKAPMGWELQLIS